MSWFMDHAVLFALLCAGAAVALRPLPDLLAAAAAGRQRADAGDRARRAGGRRRVPAPPVHGRSRSSRSCRSCCSASTTSLGWGTAIGFLIGAVLSAAAGLHRHERRRALERADGGGRAHGPAAGAQRRVPRRLRHGPPRRRARPVRRRGLLLGRSPAGSATRRTRRSTTSSGSRSAARSSPSSPGSAAASTRRPPTSAPTSSGRSRRGSRRTTRATRP